jgi:hypothetical protein
MPGPKRTPTTSDKLIERASRMKLNLPISAMGMCSGS